jgi:cysteinyl-tRNA synthetase
VRPTRPIVVTNTLGQKLQEFQPIDPPRVRLYSCGPTVYQYAHIGNFRAYIFADTLRRMLEYNGYEVTHVRNITDVGHLTNDTLSTGADKIEVMARKENVSPRDIAEHYTRAFLADAKRLNLRDPNFTPRATEYIQPMIALTQRLLDRGYAYQANGDVYYEVDKFPDYGALSGNTVEDLIGGARVEVGEEKKAPADFALWRGAGPDKIMRWESPWGEGVPGWHIECSAMSMQLLGEELDIHTGGVDNIFPHHEDEIAQSEAATGRRFVRYWMHSAWLMLAEGEKMSKSLGNIYTISELADRGFHPLSFRYFTFQAHYRKRLNFSWPALEAAQTALVRLWEGVAELVQSAEAEELTPEAAQFQSRFHQSINQDLDMPSAVAVLHDMMASRLPAGQKLALIENFDTVFGLDLIPTGKLLSETSETQRRLLDQRAEARQRKDWQLSDRLRDELSRLGLDVRDTPHGQRWVRRDLLPSGRGQLEDATKG